MNTVMDPAPPKGSWFRIIPHGPGAGRYHSLRAVARLHSSDGEELEIMESVCRQAFSVDRVVDVVAPRDPVLRHHVESEYASCGICLAGRRTGPNREAAILQQARRARDRGWPSEWHIRFDSG
jgi:hypothetical protein